MQTILSQPGEKCKTFRTVVPMYATAIEQRTTRPQIQPCAECNGSRRLEYVNPDTLEIEAMPCVFCDGAGYFTRNASRAEHRSLIERLGVWGWAVLRAVLL